MYFFMTIWIEAKNKCLKFLMNKVLWTFLCFVWTGLFRKTLNHIAQHSSGLSWSVEMLEGQNSAFFITQTHTKSANEKLSSVLASSPFLKIQARKKAWKANCILKSFIIIIFCMGLGGGIDTVLIPHLKAVLGTHLIHYLSIILFTGKTKWWEGEMG